MTTSREHETMCKIEVTFCGGHDQAEHVEQMILGLQEAAYTDDEDEDDQS